MSKKLSVNSYEIDIKKINSISVTIDFTQHENAQIETEL